MARMETFTALVGGGRRRLDRPNLLDVVVGAHLGTEEVDDDVAGVDQHPVAGWQSLDLGAAVAGVLESAQQVVGDRSDVAV